MSALFKVLVALAFVQSVHGQCRTLGDKYIGDLCYTISNQKLSFQDAQQACYNQNENLAVIHTSLQANFLASTVRSQTGAPEQKFWIGLSRPSVSSRFLWDDGTTMYWSNFDGNFPQDNLVVAESTINGKWQTLDGKQTLYFVCSYDPRGVNPSTPVYTDSPYTSVPINTDQTWQPSYPTDYPASVPVTGSTGYPASVQVSTDFTDYPASVTVNTDQTWQPPYTTGFPDYDSTGYPGSVQVNTDQTWDPSIPTATPLYDE